MSQVRLAGLAAAIVFSACSLTATRPVQEMSNAETALKAAREVNAESLVPELYRGADDSFAKAKREYRLKDFENSRKHAIKAMKLAEQAEFEAYRLGGATPEVASKLLGPEGAMPDAEASFDKMGSHGSNEPTLPPEKSDAPGATTPPTTGDTQKQNGATGPHVPDIILLAQGFTPPPQNPQPTQQSVAPNNNAGIMIQQQTTVPAQAGTSTQSGFTPSPLGTRASDIGSNITNKPPKAQLTQGQLNAKKFLPSSQPTGPDIPDISNQSLQEVGKDEFGKTQDVKELSGPEPSEGLSDAPELKPKDVDPILGQKNQEKGKTQ